MTSEDTRSTIEECRSVLQEWDDGHPDWALAPDKDADSQSLADIKTHFEDYGALTEEQEVTLTEIYVRNCLPRSAPTRRSQQHTFVETEARLRDASEFQCTQCHQHYRWHWRNRTTKEDQARRAGVTVTCPGPSK